MKLNNRKRPRILMKFDAIIPRLLPEYPNIEKLKYEQAKSDRGYEGELKVDYYTDFLADQFTIIHDICLTIHGKTLQLDTVVITTHAIFIIESKNYRNSITIDTALGQFIHDDGELESGYLYPIYQVELQQFKLQQWLRNQNLPDIPIYYFIAISDPQTIIKVIGDKEKISQLVTHAGGLVSKLIDKNEQLANAEACKFQHEKIGNAIVHANRDFDKPIMREYGINFYDLQPGVPCLNCGQLGMVRIYGKWKCDKCDHRSEDAHKKQIHDFFLLDKPWINNKMCRHWLQLPNKSIATRILKNSNLIYNQKLRRWYVPRKY